MATRRWIKNLERWIGVSGSSTEEIAKRSRHKTTHVLELFARTDADIEAEDGDGEADGEDDDGEADAEVVEAEEDEQAELDVAERRRRG